MTFISMGSLFDYCLGSLYWLLDVTAFVFGNVFRFVCEREATLLFRFRHD